MLQTKIDLLRQQRADALKILEYWQVMDFFDQENWPSREDVAKGTGKKEGEWYQDLLVDLDLADSGLGQLSARFEEKARPPKGWHDATHSSLSVYAGRVRRDSIVGYLVEKMPLGEDELPVDENPAAMAMVYFQVDQKGVYEEKSLQVSPLVWAACRLARARSFEIDRLKREDYERDMCELAQEVFAPDEDGNARPVSAIDIKRLNDKIRHGMDGMLLQRLSEGPRKFNEVAIRGRLFKNDEAAAKHDPFADGTQMGLVTLFFSPDLELVRTRLAKAGDAELEGYAPLLSYITALSADSREFNAGKRIDVLRDHGDQRERQRIQEFYADVLQPDREPLGKWPSRFPSALMQQTAINLSAGRGVEDPDGYEFPSNDIMSVNGPPGTGKTTLLKDVFAALVVEKARVLSLLEDPDQAFERRAFTNGEAWDHGYLKYAPHYYAFKPEFDRVNDYSVIVCSSNNAAVENISKELPLAEGLLKGLDPGAPEQKAVRDLFDPGAPDVPRAIWSAEVGSVPDIYFTEPARSLKSEHWWWTDRTDDVAPESAPWGLIAVPLGKQGNISHFATRALRRIINRMVKRKPREEALDEYRESRTAFREQLSKVEALQRERAMRVGRAGEPGWDHGGFPSEDVRYPVVDGDLMDALLGVEENPNRKAHESNPYYEPAYNREREKLFYLALRMTEHFVLSSKCCSANLQNLYGMWMKTSYDGKTEYRPEDSERLSAMTPLLQTLLLMVPVVSTTFALVGRMLKFVQEPRAFGLLVIDEAGQAVPQAAVGALYRCRRALVVGDPKQVEPVVTDELKLLRWAYHDDSIVPYKGKAVSVQLLADAQNPYGSSFTDDPERDWIGCPLLVHRRCDSPMFEISNIVSYEGMMRQATSNLGPAKQDERYYRAHSEWINVAGNEAGRKDHYVTAQGERALEIVRNALSNLHAASVDGDPGCAPSLYVISPFKSVVNGFKAFLCDELRPEKKSPEEEFISKNIGTVHTFQGKEADEVIFMLGCDAGDAAKGAVRWVNSNIVNVAASRAKHRLYVIGDIRTWQANENVATMKEIIDRQWIEAARRWQESGDEADRFAALEALPSVESLVDGLDGGEGEAAFDGELAKSLEASRDSYLANTRELIGKIRLQPEVYQSIGFASEHDFDDAFSGLDNVREYLRQGLLLDQLFEFDGAGGPGKRWRPDFCITMFGNAAEEYLERRYFESLQRALGDHKMGGSTLGEASVGGMTVGKYDAIIGKGVNRARLAFLTSEQDSALDAEWWRAFSERLRRFVGIRNDASHSEKKLEGPDADNPVGQAKNLLFRTAEDGLCGLLVEQDAVRALDRASRDAELVAQAAAEGAASGEQLAETAQAAKDGLEPSAETAGRQSDISVTALINKWGREAPDDPRYQAVKDGQRRLFSLLEEAGYIVSVGKDRRPTAAGIERGLVLSYNETAKKDITQCSGAREEDVRALLFELASRGKHVGKENPL